MSRDSQARPTVCQSNVCPGWDSNPHWMLFESMASADWATRASARDLRSKILAHPAGQNVTRARGPPVVEGTVGALSEHETWVTSGRRRRSTRRCGCPTMVSAIVSTLRSMALRSDDSDVAAALPASRAAAFGDGLPGTPCPRCDGAELDEAAYALLLGWYLGDGHIARARRGVFTLQIANDQKYPELNQEIAATIKRVKPTASPCLRGGVDGDPDRGAVEALAVSVSPARPRTEAPAEDRTGAVAAGDRCQVPRTVAAGAVPLRRMSRS